MKCMSFKELSIYCKSTYLALRFCDLSHSSTGCGGAGCELHFPLRLHLESHLPALYSPSLPSSKTLQQCGRTAKRLFLLRPSEAEQLPATARCQNELDNQNLLKLLSRINLEWVFTVASVRQSLAFSPTLVLRPSNYVLSNIARHGLVYHVANSRPPMT